jgi:hypothetical protein
LHDTPGLAEAQKVVGMSLYFFPVCVTDRGYLYRAPSRNGKKIKEASEKGEDKGCRRS